MVNVTAVPGQDFPPLEKVGVTVMVAVTGEEVGLEAVKEGIVPDPEAASPMEGFELVQA